MNVDLEELGGRIVPRAAQLIARYGRIDEDSTDVGPGQMAAKQNEWQGFKIKFQSPEEAEHGVGSIRIRLNGDLMFYARLERGWRENVDHISDIRSKPGDWADKFMALR